MLHAEKKTIFVDRQLPYSEFLFYWEVAPTHPYPVTFHVQYKWYDMTHAYDLSSTLCIVSREWTHIRWSNVQRLNDFCSFLTGARPRFFALRKDQVHTKVAFPSKKSRHEKVDFRHLIKKSEESYVDIQEAGLWSSM